MLGHCSQSRAPSQKDIEGLTPSTAPTNLAGNVNIRLLEGNKVATTIIKAAKDYDLIVLGGGSREGLFSSVQFGEIPEKVARYSKTPVMIVKRNEGAVKSLLKRIMG